MMIRIYMYFVCSISLLLFAALYVIVIGGGRKYKASLTSMILYKQICRLYDNNIPTIPPFITVVATSLSRHSLLLWWMYIYIVLYCHFSLSVAFVGCARTDKGFHHYHWQLMSNRDGHNIYIYIYSFSCMASTCPHPSHHTLPLHLYRRSSEYIVTSLDLHDM